MITLLSINIILYADSGQKEKFLLFLKIRKQARITGGIFVLNSKKCSRCFLLVALYQREYYIQMYFGKFIFLKKKASWDREHLFQSLTCQYFSSHGGVLTYKFFTRKEKKPQLSYSLSKNVQSCPPCRLQNTVKMAFDIPEHFGSRRSSYSHDFGSRRSAEDACKWEKPYAFTAVLLPVWEQGTGPPKRSRERIRCALGDCTAHMRCQCFCKAPHMLLSCLGMSGLLYPCNGCVHIHFWRV